MSRPALTLERIESDRFWPRIEKDPVTGCWNWTGSRSKAGYATLACLIDGRWKTMLVHRWSYRRFVGPIPEKLQIDHKCRNRRCVNPDHLEAVTQQENVRRGNGWSGRNARKTHCPKGHSYTEDNLLKMKKGRKCRICHADRERSRSKHQSRRVLMVVQQPELAFGSDAA
jgi:HNH endonuclease